MCTNESSKFIKNYYVLVVATSSITLSHKIECFFKTNIKQEKLRLNHFNRPLSIRNIRFCVYWVSHLVDVFLEFFLQWTLSFRHWNMKIFDLLEQTGNIFKLRTKLVLLLLLMYLFGLIWGKFLYELNRTSKSVIVFSQQLVWQGIWIRAICLNWVKFWYVLDFWYVGDTVEVFRVLFEIVFRVGFLFFLIEHFFGNFKCFSIDQLFGLRPSIFGWLTLRAICL